MPNLLYLLDPIGSQYIKGFVTHNMDMSEITQNQISLTHLILSPPQNNQDDQDD